MRELRRIADDIHEAVMVTESTARVRQVKRLEAKTKPG
jgi:hypothetical protein